MIGGLPKAATKTWLGTEIAVAVATGTKVCGEFFAERGTVAYCYAENMQRQIRNRLRAPWQMSRDPGAPKPLAKTAATAAKAERDAADDDAVFAFVRGLAMRGVHLTRRKLRGHDAAPLSERRTEAAINRLIDVKRLRLAGADGDEVHATGSASAGCAGAVTATDPCARR